MEKPLRFHWSLSQAGDRLRRAQATDKQSGIPRLMEQIELCQCAEESGIESMLMAIGFSRPDPLVLSVAIGMRTEKVKFMMACRSGLICPTYFVQQVNTASALLRGRICINIVCGHTPHELGYYGDFLAHDERYERTAEFLIICRALWKHGEGVHFDGKYYSVQNATIRTPFVSDGSSPLPEIFLGGNSRLAEELAIHYASCLWRFPDTDEKLAAQASRLVERGVELGLLVSLISRTTRVEALAAASALIADFGAETRAIHKQFAARSDSTGFRSIYATADTSAEWLTPYLWTGAVPYLGAPAIALVGSFAEVASALLGYKKLGISQFLFMGWPDIEEIRYFRRGVLPLVRQAEGARQNPPPQALSGEYQ